MIVLYRWFPNVSQASHFQRANAQSRGSCTVDFHLEKTALKKSFNTNGRDST